MVVSTHISQIGNRPQIGGEHKKYLKPPPRKKKALLFIESWMFNDGILKPYGLSSSAWKTVEYNPRPEITLNNWNGLFFVCSFMKEKNIEKLIGLVDVHLSNHDQNKKKVI